MPLQVGAGKTHAPPAAFVGRISRMACTFDVIGMRRCALPVLPKDFELGPVNHTSTHAPRSLVPGRGLPFFPWPFPVYILRQKPSTRVPATSDDPRIGVLQYELDYRRTEQYLFVV